MAGRGDIEAGKAHIRLYMKNSEVVKGLNWLGGKLQGLGTSALKIGGLVTGMGASIIAPFVAALGTFMAVGGELADMSARTGIAAGALVELGFAANQTGAELADVEAGTRKLNKTIAAAASGSKTARESLAAVGLTAKDLKGKLPDEQLKLVGKRLAEIPDPAKRTAATMELLGKSGTKLLPMLASLKELRTEAQRLGLAPTEEAVALADDLGDAWDATQAVIKASIFQIGAALAPALLPAAKAITNIAATVNRWVRENGALIRTVAAIGGALVAAGAVITAVGVGIVGLGAVLASAATVVGFLGVAFSALVSPIGLTIAAVVGAVAAWVRFTTNGQAALSFLSARLGEFLSFAREVFGGIVDALMAGDLQLAGQVAMAGLMVAFASAKLALVKVWEDIKLAVLGAFDEVLIAGRSAVAFLTSLWNAFSLALAVAFPTAMRLASQGWTAFKIAGTLALQGLIELAGRLSAALRVAVGVMKTAVDLSSVDTSVKIAAAAATEGFQQSDLGQLIGQATAAAAAEANKARDEAAGKQMERQAGRASAIDSAAGDVAQARAELDRALSAAAEARKAAETRAASGPAKPGTPEFEAASIGKAASFATFSAAALIAMGGGASPTKRLEAIGTRTAVAVEAMHKDVIRLRDKPVKGMRA